MRCVDTAGGRATDGWDAAGRSAIRADDANGGDVTTRRPSGQDRETWIDRQIREAQQRGEFDGLRGAGQPLADLDRPYDALWWVRRKLREENFSYLPPTLQLRREVEVARAAIGRATSERQVREVLTAINARIRHVNRTDVTGPPSTVMVLDEEQTVRSWRERRRSADGSAPGDAG